MSQNLDKVLVVEGDPELAAALVGWLETSGHPVLLASERAQALALLATQSPGAVVLDLQLSDPSRLDLLEEVRRLSGAPLLLLCGPGQEAWLPEALARGADDFLLKPVVSAELLLRIRARLLSRRRADSTRTHISDLVIDWDRAEVRQAGRALLLTAREFQLLQALYQHRSQVLTRAWLLEHLWQHKDVSDDRVIDATVKRLRRKIGTRLIETVRGLGFRLASC